VPLINYNLPYFLNDQWNSFMLLSYLLVQMTLGLKNH
jgi:hypothetical protein